jgi:hypothetical protein
MLSSSLLLSLCAILPFNVNDECILFRILIYACDR